MYLFRIHIRPDSNYEKTFKYCLDNGVLGVGWKINNYRHITEWTEYEEEALKIYDKIDSCRYINKWVKNGDLVWTRDIKGEYYLARVSSGWEYWQSQDGINSNIDIINIFRCNIKKVDIDNVPGKVISCFRPSRSIQQIADSKTLEYSKYLWNKITGNEVYKINNEKIADIFTMLDDKEIEDVIFLYLQKNGWFVVPGSRKPDTMSYEYLLVNKKSYEKAKVQVKTGYVHLNTATYKESTGHVFLFQSNGYYDGPPDKNVTCITRTEISKFLSESLPWLPGVIVKKMDILAECQRHKSAST